MRTLVFLATLAITGASAACSKPAELVISSVGDTMAYDQTTLHVKSGQKVHLVLKNNAVSPQMTHNWVLVMPDKAAQVATDGQTAGEAANYVPLTSDVIAHTVLSKPGGTFDVTFTAPDKGSYPYLCTLPGHAATMKGTLIVE